MADLTQLRPWREGLWGGAKSDLEPPFQYYAAAVTSIQVKNVPSDVHQTLRRRAVGAGQSLQEYLLQLLCEQARTETLEEVLQRAGGRAGGNIGREAAVAAVRADRDSR